MVPSANTRPLDYEECAASGRVWQFGHDAHDDALDHTRDAQKASDEFITVYPHERD